MIYKIITGEIFVYDSLAFFLYSFIGWAYESTIWAKAEKKRFINRGFLLGPLCPIYGLVSIMDWYMLSWIKNPFAIFFTAAIVCCIFEYIISWSLEKVFHQRWWDYSNYPLNLNGRISVPSGVLFGAAGLFLVKIVYPSTVSLFSKIPLFYLQIILLVLACILFADLILTVIGLKDSNHFLSSIYRNIEYRTARPFEYLNKAVVPLDKALEKKIAEAKKAAEKARKNAEKMAKKAGDNINKFFGKENDDKKLPPEDTEEESLSDSFSEIQ